MAELDKWQVREAKQYAADNEVSYDAAVKVLFPADVPEAEEAPADGKSGGSGVKAALSK